MKTNSFTPVLLMMGWFLMVLSAPAQEVTWSEDFSGYVENTGYEARPNGPVAIGDKSQNVRLNNVINVIGGTLVLAGTFEESIQIKGSANSNYSLVVEDGASIHAKHTTFSDMNANGIYIKPGATVDPSGAFYNCTFSDGAPGGTLLTIDNDQELEIENATFFSNGKNAMFNVRKSVDAGIVTFINAGGNFAGSDYEDDPFNRIIWDGVLVSQNVAFAAGWSSLSSYLVPSAPALEDVFAPIADELIIAQTMTGMYFPAENTNTIGNWPQHAAFIIKTGEPCMLPILGTIEENRSLTLATGWNLMPVLSQNPTAIEELFPPERGALIIIKEVAGTGVYWPAHEINTFETLQPGKAYLVKVAEDITIEFPE